MMKNTAIIGAFVTAASLVACTGLCSCSTPSSSVSPDDLVASYVRSNGGAVVTTGLTPDGSCIEFTDVEGVNSGRTHFVDVDEGVPLVDETPSGNDEPQISTDVAEGSQAVFYYAEEPREDEGERVEDGAPPEAAAPPADAPDESDSHEEDPPAPSESGQSTPNTDQPSAASAPAPAPAPAASAPAPAPAASAPAPAPKQLSEEEQLAREIFNKYNDFRASRGLSRVAWSDSCASMARSSASGCASKRTLTHRLGIPGNLQGSYSDVLQYASWKLSASEAVNNWVNSTGHRKQMQCGTTTEAGVGVVVSDGYWYVALVYNFDGSNQGGK